MKNFFLGLSALAFALGLSNLAHADNTTPAQRSWGGFYLSGSIGGAFAKGDAHTGTVFSPTGYFATTSVPAISASATKHIYSRGFSGGIQSGYNYLFGNYFVGGEADFSSMRQDASHVDTGVYPCCGPTAYTVKQRYKTSWTANLRPRFGFTHGPIMAYVTAGVAITDIKYEELFTDTFATANESARKNKTAVGWIAGLGLEYRNRPSSPWTLKIEGLYNDFGKLSTSSTNLTAYSPPTAFPTNTFSHSLSLSSQIYRVGLVYRF